MKAAVFYGVRDIRIEDVEMPRIQDDEILIKVKACGICGSDLHMYKLNMFSLALLRPLTKGGIPGHEVSGCVVEVGSKVREIKEGDRVVAFNSGGMAEYAPVRDVIKIPPEVSYEAASMLEPLSNSYYALMKGNPSSEENVIVFGAGTIGLGILQCVKALDIRINKLIAIDLSDFRLNKAKQIGVDETINAKKTNPQKKIKRLVESVPFPLMPVIRMPKVDVIFDCVGYVKDQKSSIVLQQAVNMASPNTGRIVIHGLFEDIVPINYMEVVTKQITLMGSYGFTAETVIKSLDLLKNKKVDQSQIITHQFPLDQAREAFETQCNINESVKVLIKP
ncbi:MAG: zinc-dependent alcohol dehydrogenase [Promethearchaeota archaeon]|jgi:threonine dehydrogenase-like Zn-dependent dehydrogenase